MKFKTIMNTLSRKVKEHKLVEATFYAALLSLPMLVTSEPAHAAFNQWLTGRVSEFDFWSNNGPLIKMMFGAGAIGVGISGWKLYEGMQDGGRVADNKGAVLGLGASMASLGLAGLIAALTPAATTAATTTAT